MVSGCMSLFILILILSIVSLCDPAVLQPPHSAWKDGRQVLLEHLLASTGQGDHSAQQVNA